MNDDTNCLVYGVFITESTTHYIKESLLSSKHTNASARARATWDATWWDATVA